MENIHEKDCSCKICSNGIREERQYALLQIEEHSILFDAEEYQHFDEWMRNRGDNKKQPEYYIVEPENDTLQLVYGVLIPTPDAEVSDWHKELKKYIDYTFATLEDKKIYLSAYQDIEIYEDMKIYEMSIPCVMLLNTVLDLKEKQDYGFGHTMFLKYRDFEIFDNIFNRQFLFCVRDIEETYDGQQSNWKEFIDKQKLECVARELF